MTKKRENVHRKFAHLIVKKEGKRFWTTDGSVCYDPTTQTWHYMLAKSLGGSGATLEEAIADAERAQGEDLAIYDN